MNMEKFTQKAHAAILAAQALAGEYNHPQIEPEHLLAREPGGRGHQAQHAQHDTDGSEHAGADREVPHRAEH